MAVSTYWYARAFVSAFDEEIDFIADDIAAQLHTSSYTADQDTHDYHADLTNELTTANGYTVGGMVPGSEANSNTANVVTFDTANPAWTSSGAGFTARILVLLDTTPGTSGTNPLILWSNFGQDETASGGGTFTYAVHATGWGTVTCADAP